MSRICVFCGSRSGDRPEFAAAAAKVAQFLADHKHTLVYGGGSTGIMGILADTMLAAGAPIIGVIPQHLARVELMHSEVTDMRVTRDMHERKATMHDLTDVYVALPGGFGTMEELFEAVTWAQLELHARPIAVLNLCGLYDGLRDLVSSLEQCGFLSSRCRSKLVIVDCVDDLIRWLTAHTQT